MSDNLNMVEMDQGIPFRAVQLWTLALDSIRDEFIVIRFRSRSANRLKPTHVWVQLTRLDGTTADIQFTFAEFLEVSLSRAINFLQQLVNNDRLQLKTEQVTLEDAADDWQDDCDVYDWFYVEHEIAYQIVLILPRADGCYLVTVLCADDDDPIVCFIDGPDAQIVKAWY